MDASPLLNERWPPDLDPATVPFRARSVTILRRMGYFDDPGQFNTLTDAEVLSWWNAGERTAVDIRNSGNEAIRRHHDQAAQLGQLRFNMAVVAASPWARQIWHRDPRFADYLPKGDATVHVVATTGSLDDQRLLWGNLEALREAKDDQAALTLPDAVAQYVEAISGQHGLRLEVLLARTGLDGRDPITGVVAARRLGVSSQRVSQLVGRLRHHRDRCRPPDGIWMPQVEEAERFGWPDEYTGEGMDTTSGFFGSAGD